VGDPDTGLVTIQSRPGRPQDRNCVKIPGLADAHHAPDERLRAVHELWTAYRELGPEKAAELLDPEIEFVTVGGETYHGHEGVRRFFADFSDRGQQFMASPFTFELHPPDVLVVGHRRIRSRDVIEGAYLYFVHSISDGRVSRLAAFATRDDAIADVKRRTTPSD
jgi:hypothetical protein